MTTSSAPLQQDRPVNGSQRGKNAYLLYAIVSAAPSSHPITRSKAKELLGWEDLTLDQAIADAQRIIEGEASTKV